MGQKEKTKELYIGIAKPGHKHSPVSPKPWQNSGDKRTRRNKHGKLHNAEWEEDSADGGTD